jgi:hypothetical protein
VSFGDCNLERDGTLGRYDRNEYEALQGENGIKTSLEGILDDVRREPVGVMASMRSVGPRTLRR